MTSTAADVPQTIQSKILGGFGWTVASTAIIQASRVVFGIALARLLTPSEYGLAGMALVFSSLVLTFSDLSMGRALVQRRDITEADRSTVFWMSAGLGVLLLAGGIGLSGPLASFYHQPHVRPLFEVVSISFLLTALQTTQASLLQREMQFRVITMRVAAANVIGGIVGVVLAAFGAGPWAIITSQICASGTSTALLWRFSSWRPKLVFSLRSLRELGGFGLNLFGAQSLNYVNRNADNILVGRFLGSAPLGAYSVAYNIMLLPISRLIWPIQDVLYPAYSRWQDDPERLARVWLRVARVTATIVCPTMIGLSIVSDEFVRVVLGERWLLAVPVLRVLAPVALLQSLALLGDRVLTALDRTRVILRFTAVECALTVPAFAIGLHWGILGVAVCYAIVTTPLQIVYIMIAARALGTPLIAFARSFSGVLEATALMAAACIAIKFALESVGFDAFERLPLEILTSALVFAGACAIRQPEVLDEIRRVKRMRAGAQLEADMVPV